MNVRFGEKRTLGGRISISVLRMAGLRPEADIELESRKRSANDPKRTFPILRSLLFILCILRYAFREIVQPLAIFVGDDKRLNSGVNDEVPE